MDLNVLAIDIHAWANETFPKRTPQSMFLKLYHEISEMIDETGKPEVGGEIADVLIMILDFAKCQGINPSVAVQRKMNINRKRQWAQNPLGDYSHVQNASCVPGLPGVGNNHAAVGGQALAHDRHNPAPITCRTHGQCLAVKLDDCANFPGDVLQCRSGFATCDGPRSWRSLPRGRANTLKGPNRPGLDQRSGEVGTAVFVPGENGGSWIEGIPAPKAV